jgi:TolA-binding protein
LRDVERGLRRAEEARELAEKQVGGLRDTKLRMEETLERERRELEDTKKAMSSMTSALDDTDGQVREIERQKTELRKRAEQAEEKLEKLQKQHRVCLSSFMHCSYWLLCYSDTAGWSPFNPNHACKGNWQRKACIRIENIGGLGQIIIAAHVTQTLNFERDCRSGLFEECPAAVHGVEGQEPAKGSYSSSEDVVGSGQQRRTQVDTGGASKIELLPGVFFLWCIWEGFTRVTGCFSVWKDRHIIM